MPIYLPNSHIWMYNVMTCTPDTMPVVAAEQYTDNMFSPQQLRFLKAPLQGFSGLLAKLSASFFFKSTVTDRVKKKEFDIIHAHFATMGWHYMELAKYAPLVISFYGFDYERLPYTNPEWKQRYKELFKVGTLFLCEGEHGKQTLIRLGCPEEKIKVTPLGMRINDIPVFKREKKEGELKLVQAAPFREKKGQLYTVRAFRQALKECPNMHLTLIGDDIDGSQKEVIKYLREQKMEESVSIYEGVPYKMLHNKLKEHQVFIHPSCYAANKDCEGGAPLVLIDAQATGMPIISTTHCDIPTEVIDEQTGFLTSEKDVSALTSSIIRFYKMGNDEYQTMATNAHNHAQANFNATECGIKLREVYQTLLT